ncbi:Uncharacterised protein [Mycobacteroides abscessus]|nr:Uncharacterised protein [Mycobacteroides abscessus]
MHSGLGAGLFGFGFLGRHLALSLGLVLLCLAFAFQRLVAGELAGGLFHFALDVFDDALDPGFESAVLVVIAHVSLLFSACVRCNRSWLPRSEATETTVARVVYYVNYLVNK